MPEFEKTTSFNEREKPKELTEEEIEKIILQVKTIISPLYEEIEKLRKENPQKEIGGYIENAKIKLIKNCKESSVIGESYQKERKMAKKGVLGFHTHPENGLSTFSGQDILATYVRFKEVIFHKNGTILLIALKELPIEEIQRINEKAWKEARQEEEKTGEFAYWIWKNKLKEKLPIRVVNIKI